ncbi:porin [Salmonella enterica subsp. enterica]|uniref:oligogalacturonate-specific porin KdgM family protein n=1 Tax=Salmonella enterica TaxID=28901 RepID=UPI001285846B|nr:oligogalacturonate-specific porin KdgM family protein [Salmonella enterica]ECA8971158.1 porin [Salmonella enterica subsp. enterica serovar Omuna]ECE0503858.1 porin [Salmonella enterica subsp. enterica]EDH5633165.1 porin [Salmonella enterica subsp. enterica serovar Claibornei]EEB9696914.1 porin [Salmonella enterica subsp. enterica serovar Miami]EEE2001692.1 porin [Salmonella enterica subsp. enterica serovar Kotte]MBL1255174.1 porin [Salmonella enterica subsp. enterica serovar Ceyco]
MQRNIVVSVIFLAMTFSASAVTIDIRHEYLDDNKYHRDRIQVSHRFANGFGFFVEGKFKSGGNSADKPFSDIVDNGSEYSLNYTYQISPQFRIQPGMELEVASAKSIYKPYLRSWYNFDSGIYLSLRYRYEYVRETTAGKEDEHINRGDIWLGYRWQNLTFETNYVYKSSDTLKYNNKKDDYEYNGRVAWGINSEWTPYIEVGNVSVYTTQDDRQTRFRVGAQYTF